jgi:hypothetical protein
LAKLKAAYAKLDDKTLYKQQMAIANDVKRSKEERGLSCSVLLTLPNHQIVNMFAYL